MKTIKTVSNRKKLRSRGVTLIELVLVVAVMVVLMTALSYAFVGGLNVERRQQARAKEEARSQHFEQYVTQLLEGAYLSEDGSDTTTFFIAEDEGEAGMSTETVSNNRITFTTLAPSVPLATLESTDDFETQHDAQGSVGGVTEVSLGTTPIGEAGDRTGLFERLQRPSDGDPTQGGTEGVLASDVTQMSFEFYDGTDWITTWDTRSTTGRLPAAVRVSYTRDGEDQGIVHQFVVPLLSSDVTASNPVTQGGG
jgi:prepilin-type N-terminal cleavage/methylation domain-containing protein